MVNIFAQAWLADALEANNSWLRVAGLYFKAILWSPEQRYHQICNSGYTLFSYSTFVISFLIFEAGFPLYGDCFQRIS
jgi:hypothetical protein